MSEQLRWDLLRSDDSEARRQSVESATGLSGVESVDFLLTALADVDWRVRKEAVSAFRVRGFEQYAAKRLVEILGVGQNVGLRNAAVEALGAHGGRAVPFIDECLADFDADGRKLAVEALGRIPSPATIPVLARLLSDPDLNVQAAAVEALGCMGEAAPEAAAKLLEAAVAQPDLLVRLAALDSMCRLRVTPGWEKLQPLIQEPVLRDSVLRLLAGNGEPKAAAYFVQELTTHEGEWRRALRNVAEYCSLSEEACQAVRRALNGLPEGTVKEIIGTITGTSHVGTRQDGLLVLAVAQHESAAELAVGLLSDVELGSAAMRALELLGATALGALAQCASSDDSTRGALAIELLSQVAQTKKYRQEVVGLLMNIEHGCAPRIARAWLKAVGEVGDVACFERASQWLQDTEPLTVRRMSVATAKIFVARFPEQARAHASDVSAGSPGVVLAAIFCGASPTPLGATVADDIHFLSAAVANQSVLVRVTALDALSLLGRPGISISLLGTATDAIAFALGDEVPEVQFEALSALARLRDGEGRPAETGRLVSLVRAERESPLGLAALRALGQSADSIALPILEEFAGARSAPLAVAAIEALEHYPAAFRDEAVRRALRHAEAEVVKAALQALFASEVVLGDGITECLAHSAWDVRRLAADMLGSVRTDEVREALASRLQLEVEEPVADAIRRSLALWGESSVVSVTSAEKEA